MISEKIVVITGVSKGFGKAFANQFKKEGFFIVGISRKTPDFKIDLHISADLTNISERDIIIPQIIEKTGKIDVFINNAGVGLYDKFQETEEKELKQLFELNFFAPVALSKQVIPFLEKTNGTLINISSVAGKIHVPFMGAYCCSKSALIAFSDTLRAELQNTNVTVLNVVAGRINTGFGSRALGKASAPETPFASTPEKLAKAVFKSYKAKKRQLVFPMFYKFVIPLFKVAKKLYDKISYNKWQS